MFMAEKGIDMPKQTVDLRGGENRQAEHLKRNPHGQMPALELDDGSYLSEITAICEYLEEKTPEAADDRQHRRRSAPNAGCGRGASTSTSARPLANGYRFGEALKFFEKRIPCAPEASPGLKMIAANRLQWLNGQMAGKEYLCGSRFTLADILLYCWLDFAGQVGQPLDPANANIAAWFARVGAAAVGEGVSVCSGVISPSRASRAECDKWDQR